MPGSRQEQSVFFNEKVANHEIKEESAGSYLLIGYIYIQWLALPVPL
jgi:hypothetical protein